MFYAKNQNYDSFEGLDQNHVVPHINVELVSKRKRSSTLRSIDSRNHLMVNSSSTPTSLLDIRCDILNIQLYFLLIGRSVSPTSTSTSDEADCV